MFSLFFENPAFFVIIALILVFSITIHEFAHAYTAMRLGDYSAKYMGRVTLNPLAHLDPIGTLMLLFVGFGWGKPVPFDPYNLSNPKRDAALISFAGPLSNLLMAVLLAFLIKVLPLGLIIPQILTIAVYYNLMLCFFNLLPFHPLDGFKVVYGLLPNNWAIQWFETEKYGIFILMLLLFTRTIGHIISPLLNTSLRILGLSL